MDNEILSDAIRRAKKMGADGVDIFCWKKTRNMDPDVAVTQASQLLRMTKRGVSALSNGEN